MRYVDPDGKVAILIPLLPAVGSIILKGAAIAGAIIGGIVVGEAIKDGIENENQESSSVQQAEKSKQSIESNAQSVTPNLEPLPPSEDDKDDGHPSFKNSKETAKEFNTDTKNFERNIKNEILQDSRIESNENKQLQKFMKKNKNPDIGVDSSGKIWLKSRTTGEVVNTQLNKSMYID